MSKKNSARTFWREKHFLGHFFPECTYDLRTYRLDWTRKFMRPRLALQIKDEALGSAFVRCIFRCVSMTPKHGGKTGNVNDFRERICSLLGVDGITRLARALRCSQMRFKYKRTSPIVLAVTELLELAKARSIQEMHWPPRWLSVQHDSDDGTGLRDRFGRQLGLEALTSRLALVLEVRVEKLRNNFAGRGNRPRAQAELLAIIELLELLSNEGCTPEAWPPRWQRRRQPRSKPDRISAPVDPQEGRIVRARVCAVLGDDAPIARLARALETSTDYLGRIWRGEIDSHGRHARVQPSLLAIVELLETLKQAGIPVEHWPKRWSRSGVRSGRPRRHQTNNHAHLKTGNAPG